jgi:hypothetical protein
MDRKTWACWLLGSKLGATTANPIMTPKCAHRAMRSKMLSVRNRTSKKPTRAHVNQSILWRREEKHRQSTKVLPRPRYQVASRVSHIK